ncbi:InlB B-repeat-containing protein, partial [uncultured Thomasclavelia sp.]|uniref:InlB B-repeat-containing protein n=1 Tax=uncultured Thomasclavelia sp. TaxID=3025759 RepID=UPI00262CDA6C
DVEYNTKTVTYGVDYVLPTPTRANYTFDGWYLDDTLLCPMSGVWTFSKVDITLKARWAGTQAEITFASDENIQVDSSPITIAYGDDYTLPVPTILTGDKFIGWADASGELVTDETGKSLKPSEFKTNIELHAVYYVPVTTPNQLLNLCTAESGDERLTRTYVLQNDLNFTGLANDSISNFSGVLNGQGFDIIGLEEPLFDSIINASIYNFNLKDFSGSTLISNASGEVEINNIKIDCFLKDENNKCEFDGIVGEIKCISFKMEQCHINDEFATINSGLIDVIDFNYSSKIDISYCTVSSNTLNHAFFGSTKSWSYTGDFGGFDDSNIVATDNDCLTNISYCSNFGDSQYLIDCFVGSQKYKYYYYSNVANKVYDDIDVTIDNYEVFVTNCVNYGKVNILLNNDGLVKKVFSQNSNKYIEPIYGFIMVRQFLNFGEIDSFGVNYSAKCSLNCGFTSHDALSSGTNNYNFTPITGISGGALSITEYSQINSDFFINTIGLDPEKWNLNYINVQDEYGLPTIIYE